jgi:hypothetical protein
VEDVSIGKILRWRQMLVKAFLEPEPPLEGVAISGFLL